MILANKWRPRKLEDVILPRGYFDVFRRWVDNNHLPMNIIFVGPAGTGKTSAVYCLAEEFLGHEIVYGKEYDDFIELNGSKDRGIDTARDIDKYAEVGTGSRRFIFIDEANNGTGAMQGSMKATMEKRAKNVVIIMACNDTSNLDPAIISRCAVFDFPPLPLDKVVERAAEICEVEGVDINDKLLRELCEYYNGDLRRIINDGIEKLIFTDHQITREDLRFTYMDEENNLAEKCKQFLSSGNVEGAINEFINAREKKYLRPKKFLKALWRIMGRQNPKIFAEVDCRIRDGADPLIQVVYLLNDVDVV